MTGTIVGVFLLTIGLLAFLYFKKSSLPRTKELGVRSTPGSFSIEEIDRATKIFVEVWSRNKPEHKSNLVKALKKITLFWYNKRIVHDNTVVFAVMKDSKSIHLWIGPLLKDKTRNLIFTGFFDQLAKLALYSNNESTDTSTLQVKNILIQIREEFKKK